MIEQQIDLWTIPGDAHCITTNGSIRADGCGVMGRGCAKEAKDRYGGLPRLLGASLQAHGNHVRILLSVPLLVAFPVKHTWEQPADLLLIERSAHELVALATQEGWSCVVLPRPGCGNGGRRWEEVEPILAPLLDDRFLVVWR